MEDELRQIEILAQIKNGIKLSKLDWANRYQVAEITINRDLRALRSLGVPVFSKNGKVILTDDISESISRDLVEYYLKHTDYSSSITPKIKALQSRNNNILSILVLVSKSIRDKLKIKIKYRRFYDNAVGDYLLKPVNLEVDGFNWILSAVKDNEQIIKSFYIQRIQTLFLTDLNFRLSANLKNTAENYEIILKFHPVIKDHVLDKIWFEPSDIYEDSNGYITIKAMQPITNRLSGWCITWGSSIEIISPKELKDHTLEMIEYFKKANSKDNS